MRILFFFIILIYSSSSLAGKFFDPKEKVLFEDGTFSINQKWVNLGKSADESIKYMIEILAKSATGKKIINLASKKAKEFGQTIFEVVSFGDKSLTDTTLIRKFSEKGDLDIVFESKSQIFIDKNLGLKEGILDLAHELTHYSLRTTFNPYSQNFSAKDFIVSTVEGRGGEVEAFLVECSVYRELFSKEEFLRSTCNKVVDGGTGKILKSKGIEQFYGLGEFYQGFKKELENHGLTPEDFPLMTDQRAIFYSSTYGLPYPIAALREFESVQKKVCQNNKNRLLVFKEANIKLFGILKKDFESQCQKFSQTPFVDLN